MTWWDGEVLTETPRLLGVERKASSPERAARPGSSGSLPRLGTPVFNPVLPCWSQEPSDTLGLVGSDQSSCSCGSAGDPCGLCHPHHL